MSFSILCFDYYFYCNIHRNVSVDLLQEDLDGSLFLATKQVAIAWLTYIKSVLADLILQHLRLSNQKKEKKK